MASYISAPNRPTQGHSPASYQPLPALPAPTPAPIPNPPTDTGNYRPADTNTNQWWNDYCQHCMSWKEVTYSNMRPVSQPYNRICYDCWNSQCDNCGEWGHTFSYCPEYYRRHGRYPYTTSYQEDREGGGTGGTTQRNVRARREESTGSSSTNYNWYDPSSHGGTGER